MPEDPLSLPVLRRPTAERPLLGITVLAVEDSRYASEALRLLCLRSGARLRRADSVAAARRHLSLYRPTVVIVDRGLPDGSGEDLLAELHRAVPRVPVLIGWSGDPAAGEAMCAAGAQEFLLKPLSDLAVFQQVILSHLPDDMRPRGLRALSGDRVEPDPIALRDDLAVIAGTLTEVQDEEMLAYAAQFLRSVARSASDRDLGEAAEALAASLEHRTARAGDRVETGALARAAAVVSDRLRNAATI